MNPRVNPRLTRAPIDASARLRGFHFYMLNHVLFLHNIIGSVLYPWVNCTGIRTLNPGFRGSPLTHGYKTDPIMIHKRVTGHVEQIFTYSCGATVEARIAYSAWFTWYMTCIRTYVQGCCVHKTGCIWINKHCFIFFSAYEHGNDSIFHPAVEKNSLIAVL